MNRRIAFDTNVLLLWLVSRVDPSLLATFKRVQMFAPEDILRLRDQVEAASQFVTTPHVLTETSNFLNQAPVHRREELIAELTTYIDVAEETIEAAKILASRPEFKTLGLSDAALIGISSSTKVITTDQRLAHFIYSGHGSVAAFSPSGLKQN